MIPVLLGKIGLPDTNTGQREAEPSVSLVGGLPSGKNPVKARIPCYEWLNAVDHGKEVTATNAGITGVDQLSNDIKFLWNYAGNCITNQHGDINKVHDILSDESKCEFILVWDTVMTDSAKYADILLPDAMRSEQLNLQTNGYTEWYTGACVGGPAQETPGVYRTSYDVMADIADKFGMKDRFAEDSEMPSWDGIKVRGLYRRALPIAIGMKDFRDDPVANPLRRPPRRIAAWRFCAGRRSMTCARCLQSSLSLAGSMDRGQGHGVQRRFAGGVHRIGSRRRGRLRVDDDVSSGASRYGCGRARWDESCADRFACCCLGGLHRIVDAFGNACERPACRRWHRAFSSIQ